MLLRLSQTMHWRGYGSGRNECVKLVDVGHDAPNTDRSLKVDTDDAFERIWLKEKRVRQKFHCQ